MRVPGHGRELGSGRAVAETISMDTFESCRSRIEPEPTQLRRAPPVSRSDTWEGAAARAGGEAAEHGAGWAPPLRV